MVTYDWLQVKGEYLLPVYRADVSDSFPQDQPLPSSTYQCTWLVGPLTATIWVWMLRNRVRIWDTLTHQLTSLEQSFHFFATIDAHKVLLEVGKESWTTGILICWHPQLLTLIHCVVFVIHLLNLLKTFIIYFWNTALVSSVLPLIAWTGVQALAASCQVHFWASRQVELPWDIVFWDYWAVRVLVIKCCDSFFWGVLQQPGTRHTLV